MTSVGPVAGVSTPALVVDLDGLDRNITTMAAALPGPALRPHVKAFKSTALARRVAEVGGHRSFCGATVRELVGMAEAGLGDDLLLANECLDVRRLRGLADVAARTGARVTVAVDSAETVAAAASAGIGAVLIDVEVGLPRCGCLPEDAGELADRARAAGLEVRGVMGYEGHLMTELDDQVGKVERAMAKLASAHAAVGGDVVSGGGTGTHAVNRWCTEIQAGSYLLMDTAYAALGHLPFEQALWLEATVVSVSSKGWAVADVGLKSLGMDHGNPSIDGATVWFCSDEHVTFAPEDGGTLPSVGSRIRVWPAHVDPTVALHERFVVVQGDDVVDTWPIDLRSW